MVNLLEQLPQPNDLSDAVGNSPIFCLGAGPGDGGLPLGGLGDQSVPEKYYIAGGGARVSGQPAQSASVYTRSCVGAVQGMTRP